MHVYCKLLYGVSVWGALKSPLFHTPRSVYCCRDEEGVFLFLFIVVVLTLTRVIKSVVTGQAPVLWS